MTTSYETGWRNNRIVVSSTLAISGGGSHGYIGNWVNGGKSGTSADSFFPDAIADNSGKYILFDFNSPTIIDEATSYESGTWPNRGTWKWQGWDGYVWNDIGGTFTLGGSPTQVHTTLNGNTTAFYRYRLLGMGGAVSSSGWMEEIEFKEDIQLVELANPTVRICDSLFPIEVVTQLPALQYTTTPPPYRLVARSQTIAGCIPGDWIEAECVEEATWNFGTTTTVCEIAGVLMLRQEGDSSSVTLADIGPLDAGPLTDVRCMSENHGTNVITSVHHDPIPWAGSKLVKDTGDFYVGLFAYASMGATIVPSGQYMLLSDGTLRAKRLRANP